MVRANSYAVQHAHDSLAPFKFERRDIGCDDVLIEILYCGVCHSDIHQMHNEWRTSMYPMVPGHEIVGCITAIGKNVKKFQIGENVGVGCLVDSCQNCNFCYNNQEQFCINGASRTYNSYEQDKCTLTYGGYSDCIVVNEKFVLKIPPNLDLARVAPLLCAGISTYAPLKHYGIKKGQRVGVVGLGGLGHMAVKFSRSLGAHVVLITTSKNKYSDALSLGANKVIVSTDTHEMQACENSLDFILSTASGNYSFDPYLRLLKYAGTMVILGLPPESSKIDSWQLVCAQRRIAGSLISGIAETQDMLKYCALQNIVADIEMIKIQEINTACARLIEGDVRYRFVIDMKSLT